MDLQYETQTDAAGDAMGLAANGEILPIPQEVCEVLPDLPGPRASLEPELVPASTTIADAIRTLLQLVPEPAEANRTDEDVLHLSLRLDRETLDKAEPFLRSLAVYHYHEIPVPPPVAPAPEPAKPKAHVLIVDDDPIFRLLLRRILEQLPECALSEATSGQEALALMESGHAPDLCITDISMPEMDGLQLLQRIRAIPGLAQLNVILCTSATERETVRKAAELNVSRYLVKPFQPVAVREQVRDLLVQIIAKRERQWHELQERLGLGAEVCVELVKTLASQIRETVVAVRGLLSSARNQAARIRVNSLKGASSILNDPDLTGVIQSLYDRLGGGNLSDAIDSLDSLESEGRRIEAMAEKLALLLPAAVSR